MNLFLSRNKYPLLLTLIFFISELIVNPIAEFPLNDDWSYAKSVLILMKEGDVYIGHWCAMTLASHVVWGFLFTKILGFSHSVLRFSNLVSSLIGILVLYKLILKISKNKELAFAACLTLLFNPIYFNLSNTFMTDINFNTWMLLGIFFVHEFFETKKPVYFFLVFFMSSILVLNRQFGIVLPFCFSIACLFTGKKRWQYTAFALLAGFAALAIFKWYESYVYRVLPEFSSYKTANKVSLGDSDFLDRTLANFSDRYKTILMNILLYAAPLAFVLYRSVIKLATTRTLITVSILNAVCLIPFFYSVHFPTGNILTNLAVGPDTFYGARDDWFHPENSHTYYEVYETLFCYAKLVLVLFSSTLLSLYLIALICDTRGRIFRNAHPTFIFLLLFGIAYVMLLFVSGSFFDRYILPLVTVFLVILAFIPSLQRGISGYFALFVIVFFYVSVFGTKDYFTINRLRWEAVNLVKKETGAPTDKINGGFEVNCWNDGFYNWWADYINIDNYNYVIQLNEVEPGFEHYREFEFQRYLPYRKDRIYIYARKGGPKPR